LRTNQFGFVQSEFPREFAAFVNFIGGDRLDAVISRVIRKFASYSPDVRSIFGDRYFFHQQWLQFIDRQFKLDVTDPGSVRAASLIAGVNRVRACLSPAASDRFRAAVIGILGPEQDVRQLEHEIRCHTHLGQKGFDVNFADLEGFGRYDLLLKMSSAQVEVECKTVAEDTGLQIKRQMSADLFEVFRRLIDKRSLTNESGIFTLTLNKPVDQCKNLARAMKRALEAYHPGSIEIAEDFSLTFESRPNWTSLVGSGQTEVLRRVIAEDPKWAGSDYITTRSRGTAIGLSLRPHKPAQLRQRIPEVLKDGADQCSGTRPSILWLHFVGATEFDFLELARFSMNSRGGGLNSITASVVHPGATTRDRSHVHTVRYSATAQTVVHKPALGPDLLLTRAASIGGACYDVPNPYCRYPSPLSF
jgi:hypothetical protein